MIELITGRIVDGTDKREPFTQTVGVAIAYGESSAQVNLVPMYGGVWVSVMDKNGEIHSGILTGDGTWTCQRKPQRSALP